ncbi:MULTISPECIES: N-acetyltransferase [unclassified Pseudocitrobacter]|jgi:putative acetyltransferase|uniref:N-acetyltransferase n=1 Tax=unclassified Pseudocitrobacter TaxID=2638778 RepID=UPI0023E38C35|nr:MULTISPECIES: N-acetyltransferase [unclassified Pseudocitrobacter]MDF3826729.1 N-acetyltransferase [Pseudocitrobacter sp. 2023EL-00150]MEC5372628.1 N-acetyltransferase [Pseudocitrobacter sp. MW920760]
MIRKWTAKSLDPVLTLWLESTTFAHPFIDEQYWHDSLALVRDVYLPAAQTWVWEENDTLLGFVSVMDNQFVGALFVAPQALHRGIGSALLNEVKQRYPMLSLEVYQKNGRAVNFYHALGFRIEDGAWQEETKHPTWIMRWQADQTPLA